MGIVIDIHPPHHRERRHTGVVALHRALRAVVAAACLAAMLFALLLSLSPHVFPVWSAPSSSHCYNGYCSPFSFDIGRTHHHQKYHNQTANHTSRASWMSAIPDSVRLSSLSIPGTHDSLTFNLRAPMFQCHIANLTTQLHSGIRYLDIRARLRDSDELHVYHGEMYTGFSLADVLLSLFAFLEEQPGETLVVRLKEEGAPLGNSTASFEEAFNFMRLNASATSAGCAKHFFLPASFSPLPTLASLRGKILLLQNFPALSSSPPYGLSWDRAPMVLEDLWSIPDAQHLDDKWDAVRTALDDAASSPDDNSAFFLAHLTATDGVTPILAAAGLPDGTVEGINDRTGRYLEKGGRGGGRTGVVITDFPGQRLVDAVLRRNHHLVPATT